MFTPDQYSGVTNEASWWMVGNSEIDVADAPLAENPVTLTVPAASLLQLEYRGKRQVYGAIAWYALPKRELLICGSRQQPPHSQLKAFMG